MESHSIFFDHIGQGKLGHEIEFAMANQGPSGKVKHHDAYYFDNIVLMSPSIKENEMAADLGVNNLKEFLSDEARHNLLVFADTESRRHARKLANILGVDFEPYVSELLPKIWLPIPPSSCPPLTHRHLRVVVPLER